MPQEGEAEEGAKQAAPAEDGAAPAEKSSAEGLLEEPAEASSTASTPQPLVRAHCSCVYMRIIAWLSLRL